MTTVCRQIRLLVLGTCILTKIAHAQVEDDEFRPGLVGDYAQRVAASSSEIAADEVVFSRIDPIVSFAWGTSRPDLRLTSEDFAVRWRGFLMSQAIGTYHLHAYVEGRIQVKLGEHLVLDGTRETAGWISSSPQDLQFDFHPLEVTYRNAGDKALVRLFWSGPQFSLEPIGPQFLFHDPMRTPDDRFERGQLLTRTLRCGSCHDIAGESAPARAPALDRLRGNLHAEWLVTWLTNEPTQADESRRRMPHFGLTTEDARALSSYLLQPIDQRHEPRVDGKASNLAKGEELLLTVGCLACHRVGSLGNSDLLGGGDLTHIAAKRPATFFERWLAAPQELNRHHRMPVFELSQEERRDLAAHLATLGHPPVQNDLPPANLELVSQGKRLFEQHRCGACHAVADAFTVAQVKWKGESREWENSCVGSPTARRPGYQLSDVDRQDIITFLEQVKRDPAGPTPRIVSSQLLAELNCLACHARDRVAGIASLLPHIAEAHPELAPLLPALTPPPLISLGDKLHDEAIREAIQRKSVHRDYLRVRMPKFQLGDEQLQTLVDYFIDTDRIPPRDDKPVPLATDPVVLHAVGSRLVTTDGFGCTSCHQLGSVAPVQAPLNARGPKLTLLANRIRREWFERFVRNPLRVIPRMEMPSVQVPVNGLLDNHLDTQLAAVWDVLNTPNFEPPLPNPVRVVRRSGLAERQERAVVITDVLRDGRRTYIKPLLIGLSNRHNLLFDLETAALVRWSLGDVARQRTEGKTWFWEAAGNTVVDTGLKNAELRLLQGGETFAPLTLGQFPTEFDELFHLPDGLGFRHRLHFENQTERPVRVTQTFVTESTSSNESGLRRTIQIEGLAAGTTVQWKLLDSSQVTAKLRADRRAIETPWAVLQLTEPEQAKITADMSTTAMADERGVLTFVVHYLTTLPVDQFPTVAPLPPAPPASTLQVVPGFEAIRLPVPSEFMPTALDWRPSGELIVASLKGRVWSLRDTDGDGLEDEARPISDELAAPYGLAAYDEHIDVVNKYGLLRLLDDNGDGLTDRTVTIASGWGHTDDYHDWAVGLPRDPQGNYYIALPCQQDKRSLAAAHLKGTVLKLSPRTGSVDEPALYSVEPLTAGHRFPMGIARNRVGEMFVTDNQGNYNPFNELNHIVPGRRYGFINAVERAPNFHPPLTPPAIDIPHPWTRSVNGICFLEVSTPDSDAGADRDRFGPFAGHLIGCEYDTRRLIRMSLEKVGETYQGAAYPFSYDTPPMGPPLLGPLVCAISPQGDLYVGGLRDSGWGGANNIGEIIRLRPQLAELPCGIAEVRALPDGFVIEFTAPVDRTLAMRMDNYALASYTRVATPAYGGPDQDRRQEKIVAVEVSEDARLVTLRLAEMRAGFVYEFHIKQLAPRDQPFFPAEAHYTLRTVPQ